MFRPLALRLSVVSFLLAGILLASWLTWMTLGTRAILTTQKNEDMKLLLDRSVDYLNLYSEGINTALRNLSDTITLTNGDETIIRGTLEAFRESNFDKIQTAACVLSEGQVLCSEQPVYDVFGNPMFLDCYHAAAQSAFLGIRWTEPYLSPLTLSRTIALYKPVKLAGRTAVVIVEINLNSMLADLMRNNSNKTMTWAVVSQQGLLIATSDDFTSYAVESRDPLTRKALEAELPILLDVYLEVSSYRFAATDYLMLTASPICMNWKLLTFAEKQSLYDAIRPLVQRNALLGLVHIILLVIAIALIGHFFTRPLTRLASTLQNTRTPFQLSFDRYFQRNDEVGILAHALQTLIDNINSLMKRQTGILEQQRILEINMLQAQIHPHFLGNTLACIASLAKENRLQDVHAALQALIKLLNYSIARTDAMVSLRDELKCADAYVALRQMRFHNCFDYVVLVPDQHMNQPIPRLLLQPVIENAIVHGFSDISYRGQIEVSSYEQDGRLFLVVDDNGVGASQARLNRVSAGDIDPSIHAHGIGMKNVFQRLHLTCPNSSTSRIEVRPEGGVRVTLDLGTYQLQVPE